MAKLYDDESSIFFNAALDSTFVYLKKVYQDATAARRNKIGDGRNLCGRK